MINQFPAGKLWDEYDKAMSQINELTERAEAAEAELHRIGSQLNEEIGKQILRAEAAEARLAERAAEVARLTAELARAVDIYKDPAVTHANILNGRIVLPSFYVNITDDFGPVADLRAALAAANEDAARLASSLENDAYPFPIRRSIDEKDAALRAHRARVGGGE